MISKIKNKWNATTIARSSRVLSRTDQRKIFLVISIQIFLSLFDLLAIAAVGVLGALAVNGVQSKVPGNRVGQVLELMHLGDLKFQTQAAVIGVLAAAAMICRTILSVYFGRKTLFFLSRRSAAISSNLISKLLTKPLIYPFFKYPDRKSIIQNFCYLIDIGGYTIDLEELKKDNNITIKKVDDILHENLILDSCNRYQLIIPDIKIKDKIIEIINKNNISDINWLLKLNKISETPTNHIGQINLGELLKEDKKYKKTAVMGLHLIDNCDYKIHDLECNIKCNYSFYKEIEYVNINDEEIEMDKQINIGHLSAIHKKLKNNYKFIINSYLRDQLKEAQIIPLEYQLYTPLRGLDYNLFFSETNRDINKIIKFLTIISYLKNNYQINDHNNLCKILIDKFNKI
jgi:hypothetical protein